MKLLPPLFLVLALCLSVARLGAAPEASASAVGAVEGDDAVLRADDERVAALVRNDPAALAGRLSDNLVYGHADGRVQGKAQLLAALAANRAQYRSIHYASREVRALGDSRAVTGVATFQLVDGGPRPVEFTLRFLAVYVREEGRWRLAAYQSTQLPR